MSKQSIKPIPSRRQPPTCPHCGSDRIKSADRIYEEGTYQVTHSGYSLGTGRYRGISTAQSGLAQRAARPTAPTMSAIPIALWIVFWFPGVLWELFYCLTGGMSQQAFVASSVQKFLIMAIGSVGIWWLQKIAYDRAYNRYWKQLGVWTSTYFCLDCGESHIRE